MPTPINIYIFLFSTSLIFQLINGNQEQCIGIGGPCDYDNDCCGDRNINCVGAKEHPKKEGICKKTCDLVGTPCKPAPHNPDGNCCNYCDSKYTNKCSYKDTSED